MSVKKVSGLFESVDCVLYLASAKLFKNQIQRPEDPASFQRQEPKAEPDWMKNLVPPQVPTQWPSHLQLRL